MRTIEGHHDFGVLESRLAALIREAHEADPGGPLAPVAVIVPTRRLLAYLQADLASRFPGLANLHLFHHESLARAAAAAAGASLPRAASERVREQILARLIAGTGGELPEYVAARPGSISALRSAIDDLREAVVPPAAAGPGGSLSPRGAEILRLHALYADAMRRLERSGWSDRTGHLRAAAPHLAGFARRFRLVVHYGAYDLIGVNLELMRAVEASGVRLVYLAPYHAGGPAFAHARRFWPEMLGATPAVAAGDGTGRLLGEGLPLLYDESSSPGERPSAGVAAFHAQGAAGELRETALRILALHRDHRTPLRSIGVIARSLEPYAPHLAPIFEDHGLPFTTSASLGALRDARVLAARHLARATLLDFERQPLIDLLRSGLARLDGRDPAARAHAWDRLSRDWRVARGFETWTAELPRWLESWTPHPPEDADDELRRRLDRFVQGRRRDAVSLAAAVKTLRRVARPVARARDWRGWADALESACGEVIAGFADGTGGPEADPGGGVIRQALDDLRILDDAGIPFAAPAALAFFENALAGASIPVASGTTAPGEDNGGVRVLDAMQARGLGFDAVFLIGFNADLYPRRPREDPFLGDADRRRLRERYAVPIPHLAAARDEERLLLAHLLGAARRRLTVSWQRSDEEGRARVPSLALREVARLAFGGAESRRLEERATRVPGHPGQAGRDAATRHGLLPAAEAGLNVALELGYAGLVRAPERLLPGAPRPETLERLSAGLRMLAVIEDAASAERGYDALVHPPDRAAITWSPSRLERLGSCPQHYFFRHLLHVDELTRAAEGYEIDPLDLGLAVHATLQQIYRGLHDGGHLAGGGADPRGAIARALALLEPAWSGATRSLAERLRSRYPLLWDLTAARWNAALRAFLARDVGALATAQAAIAGLEREVRVRLPLDRPGATLDVRGRFDRICRTAAREVVVTDYKTSGDLEAQVSPAEILKGSRLQIAVYRLMAERLLPELAPAPAEVRAELLGVGPAYDAEGGGRTAPREVRAALDEEAFGANRAGILETLAVLSDLASAGFYPLDRDSRLCGFCPYLRACRRGHPPTLERLRAEPAGADYLLLRRKSTRAPTLAEVRARSAAEGDE